jgi:hypothetical protein
MHERSDGMPGVFLWSQLEFSFGSAPRVCELVAKTVPFSEKHGWVLRGTYMPLIGNDHGGKLILIWEAPDMAAIGAFYEAAAAEASLAEVAQELAGILTRQDVSIMVDAPLPG